MSKCPICGKDYVSYSKDDQVNVLELFKENSDLLLKMCYTHNYNYCPTCCIAEHDYTKEQVELLKQKHDSLEKVLNNAELDEIDPKKYFRVCELAGYCYELINNHELASIAYMAGVDILNAQLLNFVNENKKEHSYVEKENNKTKEMHPVLSPENYLKFSLGVEKLAMLRRLVLGHGSKAVENSHSVAVDFIIIQVLAGLGDYNNAREMLKHLKIAVGEQGEPFNSMAQALEEQIDRLEKNNPKKQD